jgi:UDP-N-acetylglucosamine diphosphorylase / glucose-1-phosphate thymidylyltransferase / UDP-N-acetylgalactosamine diphosphorylase / glucosamine-1-phosphate N-acetyltransferase / galactosamine-1-phosphate N-acetyltransferase
MRIVIPMAGRGARFVEQQITRPKPLIDALGKPMLAWALQSLRGLEHEQHIFIALAAHDREFGVRQLLTELLPNTPWELLLIDDVTEGQLCTVLVAREFINNDEPVLIAPCDTFVVSDIAQSIAQRTADCTGIISVADLPGDRWSFARTDEQGRVVEVAEKVRISNHASTGLYFYSQGRELVRIADDMIARQEKTRGEYYVIPVYQHLIAAGKTIELDQATAVWDLGTPEAKAAFEREYLR